MEAIFAFEDAVIEKRLATGGKGGTFNEYRVPDDWMPPGAIDLSKWKT